MNLPLCFKISADRAALVTSAVYNFHNKRFQTRTRRGVPPPLLKLSRRIHFSMEGVFPAPCCIESEASQVFRFQLLATACCVAALCWQGRSAGRRQEARREEHLAPFLFIQSRFGNCLNDGARQVKSPAKRRVRLHHYPLRISQRRSGDAAVLHPALVNRGGRRPRRLAGFPRKTPNGGVTRSGNSEGGGRGSAFIPVWIVAARLDSTKGDWAPPSNGPGGQTLEAPHPPNAHICLRVSPIISSASFRRRLRFSFFFFFLVPSPRADRNNPAPLQAIRGMKQTLAADSCDCTSSGELSPPRNKRDDILPRAPSASLRFELFFAAQVVITGVQLCPFPAI